MLCMQCEQTAAGSGCSTVGVCSKTPALAGLQDLQVLYILRICQLAHSLGPAHPLTKECRDVALESLFATLTNVNFDDERFVGYLETAAALVTKMEAAVTKPLAPLPGLPKELPADMAEKRRLAAASGLLARGAMVGNEDVFGVVEMGIYGLKGTIAYFYHAEHLNAEQPAYTEAERDEIYSEIFRIGSYLARAGTTQVYIENEVLALNEALGEALAVGALNLKVMKHLDAAHTGLLGTPEPTSVATVPSGDSHAILVSGHDLAALRKVLQQSEGKGVDVYTHGEMLPAHSYPGLKSFPHLKGHFGTHWGQQLAEFKNFPGPILMTSNCLRPPTRRYKERLWTTGPVGFDNIPNVSDDNFMPVIDQALSLPTFGADNMNKMVAKADWPQLPQSLTVGFGHSAILGAADKVVAAIKAGALKNVFIIGGCDGTESSRNYFTELARETPNDSIILTLGCGKFRLLKDDHGTLGDSGLPRLFDMGQCNDAYGALVVATKLAEALDCKVSDLPLRFAVSWFEQKAIAVLLTLLHLELKNIRVGPAVPAFLTPTVVEILNQKLGLMPIDAQHEDDDLEKMLAGQ